MKNEKKTEEFRVNITVHLRGHVYVQAESKKDAKNYVQSIGAEGRAIEVYGMAHHEEPFFVDFTDAELTAHLAMRSSRD